MKRMRFLTAVFAVAVMVILALTSALTASAAAPDTWTVYYDKDKGEWAYLLNKEHVEHWELYYFYEGFKDGDKLVVDGADATQSLTLDMSKRISELAFSTPQTCVVNAPGVDYVYSLQKSVGILNADAVKAAVFEDATLQINGNVKEFYAKAADGTGVHANAYVSGTVDYAEVTQYKRGTAALPAYNFEAGSFSLKKDTIVLATPADKYSINGTVPSQSASVENASAKELDAVPKTGGFDYTPVFFMLSFVFLAGGVACSRRKEL
ncbi:MAG: hypothetical protein K6G30_01970 [Acetatifactor sp.]|nr:hypothetical protein [Acetatifactor sp.]